MRQIITVSFAAISIVCLGVNMASAEGLSGDQIKKLLIGNTVYSSLENLNHVKTTRWAYYKDATTRIVRQKRGKNNQRAQWRDFTTEWSVTKNGKICHSTRRWNKRCRTNVRVSGNMVTMDGIRGVENLKYKLLKGNPQNLK